MRNTYTRASLTQMQIMRNGKSIVPLGGHVATECLLETENQTFQLNFYSDGDDVSGGGEAI